MNSKEAENFISKHKESSYTLLDVRQNWEYQEKHIPGGKLIPLPDLTDRINELQREKPIIVYCASGNRSLMAAQILMGQGFMQVYNLLGGITAWSNKVAAGPLNEGLNLITGNETIEDIIFLAYGLEEGLGSFYKAMALKMENSELADTFNNLGKAEDAHKTQIYRLCTKINPAITDREFFESKIISTFMEGGLTTEEFLIKHRPILTTVQDIIEMAMMIEAQAFDLYLRYTDKVKDEESRKILFELAESEKTHLKALGRCMDNNARPDSCMQQLAP
jgi:rhodanese-related sulfurtransferase/rubrerythrin